GRQSGISAATGVPPWRRPRPRSQPRTHTGMRRALAAACTAKAMPRTTTSPPATRASGAHWAAQASPSDATTRSRPPSTDVQDTAMNTAAAPQATTAPGAWSPLSQPTFRMMWLAVLVGNVGTWIHDVAAAWVMAENTGSPFMVAAVQSATTLPVVLLAVFAGTLADIVDRRRYLILAQLWMLLVAGTLALLAHLDMLGPWTLIALTFALGIGAAMAMPAQQATVPELVPRAMLSPAVALSSLSMNIARAIGPALGGLIVASAGIGWAFA